MNEISDAFLIRGMLGVAILLVVIVYWLVNWFTKK